jgi:hypothetical protein
MTAWLKRLARPLSSHLSTKTGARFGAGILLSTSFDPGVARTFFGGEPGINFFGDPVNGIRTNPNPLREFAAALQPTQMLTGPADTPFSKAL